MSTLPSNRKHTRKEMNFKQKGTLIISPKLQSIIHYCHYYTGNKEWSGILVYKVLEGDISNPETLVIKAEDLLFMDIGTSGYTEYELQPDDDYMMDGMANAFENGLKLGHIHTHHGMSTFFSGVDTDELHDNAPNHNYYLSLIVNYQNGGDYVAKIAICGTEKTEGDYSITRTFRGNDGEETFSYPSKVNNTEELLYTINMEVELESPVTGFADRFIEIQNKKKNKYSYSYPRTESTSRGTQSDMFDQGYSKLGNVETGGKEEKSEEKKESTSANAQGSRIAKTSTKEEYNQSVEFSLGRVRPFVSKLLAEDFNNDDAISLLMSNCLAMKEDSQDIVIDNIEYNLETYAQRYWGRKLKPIEMHILCNTILEILQPFNRCRFYDKIAKCLDVYILPNLNETISLEEGYD